MTQLIIKQVSNGYYAGWLVDGEDGEFELKSAVFEFGNNGENYKQEAIQKLFDFIVKHFGVEDLVVKIKKNKGE